MAGVVNPKQAEVSLFKTHLPWVDLQGLTPEQSAFQRTHPKVRQQILDGLGVGTQQWSDLDKIHRAQSQHDRRRAQEGRRPPYSHPSQRQPWGNPSTHPQGTTMMLPVVAAANPKLGDCYRQAYKALMKAPEGWTMMHGDMLSPLDRRPGGPFPNGHAVLFDTENTLHDPVMGAQWPDGAWQHLYNFQPGARTFTKDQAQQEALDHDGVAGPWHDTQTDYERFGKQSYYDYDRDEYLYEIDHPDYPNVSDFPPSAHGYTSQPLFKLKNPHPEYSLEHMDENETIAPGEEKFDGEASEGVNDRWMRDQLEESGHKALASANPDETGLKAAGIAVIAMDTGRVLMLQRALNPLHCPCGQGVTWDEMNGYQHDDGSVSHDGEYYGQSVSDLLDQGHPEPMLCPCCLGQGDNKEGSECTSCDGSGSDQEEPSCDPPCREISDSADPDSMDQDNKIDTNGAFPPQDDHDLDKISAVEHDPNEGVWEFPGGCLDEGEPARTAAIREFREEVGQDLPPGVFVGAWLSPGGKVSAFSQVSMQYREVTSAADPAYQQEFYDWARNEADYSPEDIEADPALKRELADGFGRYIGEDHPRDARYHLDAGGAGKQKVRTGTPGSNVRVLRVEKPDGTGPFAYGGGTIPRAFGADDDRDQGLYSLLNPVHLDEGDYDVRQRQPYADGIPHRYVRGRSFGFLPQHKIGDYFTPTMLKGLHDRGFGMSEYDVPGESLVLGRTQAAWKPEDATRVSHTPLLNYLPKQANTMPILDGSDPRALGQEEEQYGLDGVFPTPGRGDDPALQRVAEYGDWREVGLDERAEVIRDMRREHPTRRFRTPGSYPQGYVTWDDIELPITNQGRKNYLDQPMVGFRGSDGSPSDIDQSSAVWRSNEGVPVCETCWQEREQVVPESRHHVHSNGLHPFKPLLPQPGERRFAARQAPFGDAEDFQGLGWHRTHPDKDVSWMKGDDGAGFWHQATYEDDPNSPTGGSWLLNSFAGSELIGGKSEGFGDDEGYGDLHHQSPHEVAAKAGAREKQWLQEGMRDDKFIAPGSEPRPVMIPSEDDRRVRGGGGQSKAVQVDDMSPWHPLHPMQRLNAKASVYKGFIYLIQHEREIDLGARAIANPDDPDGDMSEQVAWWDIEHAKKNPALRKEVKTGTPWSELELWADKSVRTNKEIKEAVAKLAMGLTQHDADNSAFQERGPGSVYVRFGDWPVNERSMNHITGYPEEGVSVYDLNKQGNPMDPDSAMNRGYSDWDEEGTPVGEQNNEEFGDDTADMLRGHLGEARRGHNLEPRRRAHLVKGTFVGFGHDDEPLLENVQSVGHWPCDVHKFVPGLKPQSPSWCEHQDHEHMQHEAAQTPAQQAAQKWLDENSGDFTHWNSSPDSSTGRFDSDSGEELTPESVQQDEWRHNNVRMQQSGFRYVAPSSATQRGFFYRDSPSTPGVGQRITEPTGWTPYWQVHQGPARNFGQSDFAVGMHQDLEDALANADHQDTRLTHEGAVQHQAESEYDYLYDAEHGSEDDWEDVEEDPDWHSYQQGGLFPEPNHYYNTTSGRPLSDEAKSHFNSQKVRAEGSVAQFKKLHQDNHDQAPDKVARDMQIKLLGPEWKYKKAWGPGGYLHSAVKNVDGMSHHVSVKEPIWRGGPNNHEAVYHHAILYPNGEIAKRYVGDINKVFDVVEGKHPVIDDTDQWSNDKSVLSPSRSPLHIDARGFRAQKREDLLSNEKFDPERHTSFPDANGFDRRKNPQWQVLRDSYSDPKTFKAGSISGRELANGDYEWSHYALPIARAVKDPETGHRSITVASEGRDWPGTGGWGPSTKSVTGNIYSYLKSAGHHVKWDDDILPSKEDEEHFSKAGFKLDGGDYTRTSEGRRGNLIHQRIIPRGGQYGVETYVNGVLKRIPIPNSKTRSYWDDVKPNTLSADEMAKEVARRHRKYATSKCSYCDNPATKTIVHSEGIGKFSVCDNHLAKGKDMAEHCTPGGEYDPTNISSIKEASVEWWRYGAPLTMEEPRVQAPVMSGEDARNHWVGLSSGEWLRKRMLADQLDSTGDYKDLALDSEDRQHVIGQAGQRADVEEFASKLGRALSHPAEEPIAPEAVRGNKASDLTPTVYVRKHPQFDDMENYDLPTRAQHVDTPRGKVIGFFHSVLGDGDKALYHNMGFVGDHGNVPVSIDHTHSSLPEYAEAMADESQDSDQVRRMRWNHEFGEISPFEHHFLGFDAKDNVVRKKANPLAPGDAQRVVAAAETMRPWAQSRGLEPWLDAAQKRMTMLGRYAAGTESMFPYAMHHEQGLQVQARDSGGSPPGQKVFPALRDVITAGKPEYSIRSADQVHPAHHDTITDSESPVFHQENSTDPAHPSVYALRNNGGYSFLAPVTHNQTGEDGWLRGSTNTHPDKWRHYKDETADVLDAVAGKPPQSDSARKKSIEGDVPLDEEGHQLLSPRRDTWAELGKLRGFADDPELEGDVPLDEEGHQLVEPQRDRWLEPEGRYPWDFDWDKPGEHPLLKGSNSEDKLSWWAIT